jgi:glycosyltransferase involved in cell wall biosynthesis
MNRINPEISVVIPVYNAEEFLSDTIDSVLVQTFSDFELLLMDDGSTDRTAEIIKSYQDKRIRYIPCPHDFIATTNHGFELAEGKYIALLDHDDLMVPRRLQMQYDYMEAHPNVAACGGAMHTFGKQFTKWHLKEMMMEEMMPIQLLHSPVMNPTGFVRREFLLRHKIVHQRGYSFATDFKFWFEISKVGKIVNLPQIFTLYRMSDRQTHVKFRKQLHRGEMKIRWEVLEYLLAHLKLDHPLAKILESQLIPSIETIGERGYFSEDVFYKFMYEMITGLVKDGVINLK